MNVFSLCDKLYAYFVTSYINIRDPQIRGRSGSSRQRGWRANPTMITVTKNEILTALNKPESFTLAIVAVDGEHT